MSSTLAWIVAAVLAHVPVAPTPAVDGPAVTGQPPAAATPGPMVDLRPLEVRIRKLYLIRPDLLQFPIPYDTVC